MKDFFKDNKYFAVYLLGTLIYVSGQLQSGNVMAALVILLFVVLLFLYLYHIRPK